MKYFSHNLDQSFDVFQVFCSRYVNEHMVKHGESTGHPVVLSYADLSVWCYPCENYIDTGNPVCYNLFLISQQYKLFLKSIKLNHA